MYFGNKKYLLLAVLCLFAVLLVGRPSQKVSAANPALISFQGKVVNADGTNVTNGSYNFDFVLYDDLTLGTPSDGVHDKWHELTKSVTVTNGIFQTNLGSATALPDFNANPSLYLAVRFNADAAGYMSPRVQMASVPYALNADKVGGVAASSIVQLGASQSGNINIGAGTLTSGLINGQTIGTSANFTGTLVIQGAATTIGTTSVQGGLVLHDGNGQTATLQVGNISSNGVYTIPSTAGTTDTFCLFTLANCAGGGTLQTNYTASTGSTTPEIVLDTTRNGLDIQDQTGGTIGATQSLLSVRGVATASTLGASLFVVNATGQIGIKNGGTTATPTLSYDLSFGQNSTPTDRTIGIEDQGTAATVGNALTISSGKGNTTGNGGLLTIRGGQGGASGVGGGLTLQAGAGGSTTGAGGVVTIQGGSGSAASSNGGAVVINGGTPNGFGTEGAVNINTNVDGAVNINTGTSGGAVTIGSTFAGNISVASNTFVDITSDGNINLNSETIVLSGFTPAALLQVISSTLIQAPTSGDSTTFFQVQGTADTSYTIDTVANKLVVGNSTGTNTATTLLVVDSATADPSTGFNGAIFYNSTSNKFRCYQTSWTDCIGAGSGSTLQGSYTTSTGGTTPEIILDATRNGIDIQDQTGGTIGATQGLLSVRGVGTASTFGASLFVVNATGQVGIKNGGTTATPTLSYDLSFGQDSTPTSRTIGIETQATAATNGNALTVSAGTGNTTGNGGMLTLRAGNGGTSGDGGLASLNGGTAGGGNSTGGNVGVFGGAATGTQSGGALNISGGIGGSSGGAGGSILFGGGAGNGAGSGGSLFISSGNGGASGAAGNLTIDVGTSGAGNGTISIGTAARTQTITIGNSTGGTITLGASSNSNLVLNDAQWSVSGAGAALFASVGAGSGTITTSGTIGSASTTTFTGGAATFTGAVAFNQTGGNDVIMTQAAGSNMQLTASAVPTVDQLAITNAGQGVTTVGVNGLGINYVGGAAAVEAAGARIDVTPGGTTGGTWSGLRIVANGTGAVTGVTEYGVKIEGPTSPGAGTETGVYIGTGWDTGLDVQSGGLNLAGYTTGGNPADPPAPAADNLRVYAKKISGKMMLKTKGPSGLDQPLQPAIFNNNQIYFTPTSGSTVTGGFGTLWVTSGTGATATTPTPSTTAPAISSQMHRYQKLNVVTTQNQALGVRTTSTDSQQFWMGNAAGLGGFFFFTRFVVAAWPAATVRIFAGLTSGTASTTQVVTSDTVANDVAGLWHDTTDSATTFNMVTRNNTTTTKTAISLSNAIAAGSSYDWYMYVKPNDTTVYYRLDDIVNGVTYEGNTSTTVPRSTIFMMPQVLMSNGTANTTASTSGLGINRIYVESDY